MMRTRSKPRRAKALEPLTLEDLLWGTRASRIVTLGAAFAAVAVIWSGALRPVLDSGPLPLPSRAEVEKLRQETDEKIIAAKKGLDQTLEVAKAANVAAQQAVADARANRLTRLLQQKVQIESLIAMNPNDVSLKTILEQTTIDIARLTSSEIPARTPASAVVPLDGAK